MFCAIQYNLSDDAYITLAYAKQLAFHGNWGNVAGHSANSATSPLNVLLIAFGTVVTRRPLLALGITYVAAFSVLAWATARAARALDVPLESSVLAVALVFVNPIVLSSTGLESIMYIALLATMLCFAVEGRTTAFAVVAGLALLCRLDTILFIVPFVCCTATLRRRALRTTGIALAICLPWFVARWFTGSALPDTFVIKTLQHALFGDLTFANWPFRLIDSPTEAAGWSVIPMLAGAATFVVWFVVVPAAARRFDRRFWPVVALGIGGSRVLRDIFVARRAAVPLVLLPGDRERAIVLAFVAGDVIRFATCATAPSCFANRDPCARCLARGTGSACGGAPRASVARSTRALRQLE